MNFGQFFEKHPDFKLSCKKQPSWNFFTKVDQVFPCHKFEMWCFFIITLEIWLSGKAVYFY